MQTSFTRRDIVFVQCQDGFTALTLAAKEGFSEISNMLLQHDAYVNLPDRVLLTTTTSTACTTNAALSLSLIPDRGGWVSTQFASRSYSGIADRS